MIIIIQKMLIKQNTTKAEKVDNNDANKTQKHKPKLILETKEKPQL